jgi:Ca-activated chloride channel family protein
MVNAMQTRDDAQMSAKADPQGSGGRLVTATGQTLPLVGTNIRAEAGAGLARVILEQRFRNVHALPLRVTYVLPLPSDGAVSGFRFRIGDKTITGEIDKRARARERFEEALVEGKTAALLEQTRSSVFTQEVGNIPPGAEIVAEVTVDQPLAWLTEGDWEWRFPTVVGPRYMGEPGRVKDADALTVDVSQEPLGVRAKLTLEIKDAIDRERRPHSPSHAITSTEGEGGSRMVGLASGDGARLDRDIVVRWPVARKSVGVSIMAARSARPELGGSTFGLLTLVPPAPDAEMDGVRRDLIALIDVSGSMSGPPLEQAKRILCAMIDSLGAEDRLEMIAFAARPTRWQREPVVATIDGRLEAIRWVKKLTAGGGTEMVDATIEALRPLSKDSQRQVVLITDGYIGFESKLIETLIAKLPKNARLHTVGVGSAVNRSLTQPAARAGAGIEVIVGLDEDVERAARRIVERTRAPLVTELEVSGPGLSRTVPAQLPDLFAGAPAMIAVELLEDSRELRVRGKTARGAFEHTVTVPSLALGQGHQAIVQLFGREAVEDEEMRIAAGQSPSSIDPRIERMGLDFQIATRLTSWIAMTSEATVSARDATIEEHMPHELPYGTSIEGLGLRAGQTLALGGAAERPRLAAARGPTGSFAPAPSKMKREKDAASVMRLMEPMDEREQEAAPAQLEKLKGRPTPAPAKPADPQPKEPPRLEAKPGRKPSRRITLIALAVLLILALILLWIVLGRP